MLEEMCALVCLFVYKLEVEVGWILKNENLLSWRASHYFSGHSAFGSSKEKRPNAAIGYTYINPRHRPFIQ